MIKLTGKEYSRILRGTGRIARWCPLVRKAMAAAQAWQYVVAGLEGGCSWCREGQLEMGRPL